MTDTAGTAWDPAKIRACVDECVQHHDRHTKHMGQISGVRDELRRVNPDTFGVRVHQLLRELDALDTEVNRKFAEVVKEFGHHGRAADRTSTDFTEQASHVAKGTGAMRDMLNR